MTAKRLFVGTTRAMRTQRLALESNLSNLESMVLRFPRRRWPVTSRRGTCRLLLR